MHNKTSIIYVIGAGRSGTTLLDIILGNNKGIFSAGELNRFTEYNGLMRNARNTNISEFWQKVRTDLNLSGYDEPGQYYKLFNKFEYHKNFWRVLIPFKANNSSFEKYASYQKKLFAAIQKNAEVQTEVKNIVDSSKYPVRAYFLSKIFPQSISFIYIKRNPSDVVTSFQKKDIEQLPKNNVMAHLYILCVNYISTYIIKLLRKKNFKTSTIYYEQLSSNTIETLSQIENDLHIDLSLAKSKIETNKNLTVGLLFEGNRLRLQNEILFERKERSPSNNILNRILMPVHKMIWYSV